MVLTLDGNTIVLRPLHIPNASLPILVTTSGISTDSREAQDLKVPSGIVVMAEGNTTVFNDVHPAST